MSSLESAHRACELGECQARVHLHLISSDHRSTAYQLVRGTCERGERGPREITQDASVPSMLRRDGGTKPVMNMYTAKTHRYKYSIEYLSCEPVRSRNTFRIYFL